MSAIHQALQKAEYNPAEPLTDEQYNPLANRPLAPKRKTASTLIYWFLAALFIALVPVVIFWPIPNQAPIATAETTNNNQIETTVEPEKAQPLDSPQTDVEEPLQAPIATQPASSSGQAPQPVSNDMPAPMVNATVTANETEAAIVLATSAEKAPSQSTVQPEPTVVKKEPAPAKTQAIKPASTQSAESSSKTQNAPSSDVVTASAQHWQRQVETHIANGDIEYAEAVLKQWIGASPKDEAPRIWLARIYISNNLFRPAESLINEINSNEALALKGVIFEKTQRFVLAAEQFSELFNREPDSGRWLIMWAVNTENSGQISRAVGLYKGFINNFNYEDPKLVQFAQQRLQSLGGS